MAWGFAAGELVGAAHLATALEPLARAFAVWEVTGEAAFATPEGLARVREVLPSFALRLTFHAAFRKVDLAAPDPATRERDVRLVAGQVAAARSLGAEAIVVHPGKRIRGLADPRAEERCRASLAALAGAGREHGVQVRVENMPAGDEELARSGAALASLAEVAGAACWDLGHARTWPAGSVPGAALRFVREAHLHHNRGRGDDHFPLEADDPWWVPALDALERPGLVVVLEHRRAEECLVSLRVAQAALASPRAGAGRSAPGA